MNANPDNTPMAQRALKIHDQHGESAMLEYTAASADTKPHGQETNPHSLAVLADHTTVAHTPAAHIFMWMEDQNLVPSKPARDQAAPASPDTQLQASARRRRTRSGEHHLAYPETTRHPSHHPRRP